MNYTPDTICDRDYDGSYYCADGTTDCGHQVEDMVKITLTVPRKFVESGIVRALRESGCPEGRLRIVGAVPHIVREYGHYHGVGLVWEALDSIAGDRVVPRREAAALRRLLDQWLERHEADEAA